MEDKPQAKDVIKRLSELDAQVTQWVKSLPVVDLNNYRRIREKRAHISETIKKMGY